METAGLKDYEIDYLHYLKKRKGMGNNPAGKNQPESIDLNFL